MKSPCRAACKNNGGICSGCHRTIEEIIQWKDKSDKQRDAIINQISGNDSTHACPECGSKTYCGIEAGEETCWCFDIEPRDLPKPEQDQQCLCRHCLEKEEV